MPKGKRSQKKSLPVPNVSPSRLVPSSLGVDAKALAIKPLHDTIVCHQIGQWVAIPGCDWALQVFPNKFIIQDWGKRKPSIEITFDLDMASIPDHFLIQLHLKKGQINVEISSGDIFLRWRLYSNTTFEPIFELLKWKGQENSISGFYNQEPCQWALRTLLNLIQRDGSTTPRAALGIEAQLWFGTNRKLDWHKLTAIGAQKETIAALMHQWTLALQWINPTYRSAGLIEELRHFLISENESFIKRWWQLATAYTIGPMVPVFSAKDTSGAFFLPALEKPMEWMQAMGEVLLDRWVKTQDEATYFLNAEATSKIPSGRAYIKKIEGLNLKWRWRANRTDLIYLESLETKTFKLKLKPYPKQARLTKLIVKNGKLTSSEVKILEVCKIGKFLDVELVKDTHYLLDRFEY